MRVLAYSLALVCLCPVGYATPLPPAFTGVSEQSHSPEVDVDQVGHDLSVFDGATTEQVDNDTKQATIDAMVSDSFATASDINNCTIINIDPLSTGTSTVPGYNPFIRVQQAASDATNPMFSSSAGCRRRRPRGLDAANINAYGVAETVAGFLTGPYAGYTVGLQVMKLSDEWELALAQHESDGSSEVDASDAEMISKQGDMSQDVGWCSRGFASRLRSKCATAQAEAETAKRIAVDAAAEQQAVEAELSACSALKDDLIQLNAELATVMERDNAKAASERRAVEEKLKACSASKDQIIQLNAERATVTERDKAKAASERQAVEERLDSCSATNHEIMEHNSKLQDDVAQSQANVNRLETNVNRLEKEKHGLQVRLINLDRHNLKMVRERKRSTAQLEYFADKVAALSKQLTTDNENAAAEQKHLQNDIAFYKAIVKVMQVTIVFLLLMLFRLCCNWASALGPELTGEEDDDDADDVEKGLFRPKQAPVSSHIATTRCDSDNDHTFTSTTSDDAPSASSPSKVTTVDSEANIASLNTSQDRADTVPSPYDALEGSHSDLSEATSPVPSATVSAPAVVSSGSASVSALAIAPTSPSAIDPATAPAKAPASVPSSPAASAPAGAQTKAPAVVPVKAVAKAPGSVLGGIPGSPAASAPAISQAKAPAVAPVKVAAKVPGSVPGSPAAKAPACVQAKEPAVVPAHPAKAVAAKAPGSDDQRPWQMVLSKRDKLASKKETALANTRAVVAFAKVALKVHVNNPKVGPHLLLKPKPTCGSTDKASANCSLPWSTVNVRAFDIQGNSPKSSPKPVITPAAVADNAATSEKSTWKLTRIDSEKRVWRLSSVKDIEQTQNRLLAAINGATASIELPPESRNVCIGFEEASTQHVRPAPPTIADAQSATNVASVRDAASFSNAPCVPHAIAVSDAPSLINAPSVPDATAVPDVLCIADVLCITDVLSVTDPPNAPDAADVPDAPCVPDGPSVPDASVVPDAPSVPDVASVIGAPSGLDAPSGPHAPSDPDVASYNGAPSGPDAPSDLDAPRVHNDASVSDTPCVTDVPRVPDAATFPDASVPGARSDPDTTKVSEATIVSDNADDSGIAAPSSSPPAPRVKTRGGKAEKKKKMTYSGTAVRDVTDAAAWCLWRLARSSSGSYPELDKLEADASLQPSKIAGMALYQLLESAKPDKPEYVGTAVLKTRLPSIVKSDSTLLSIKPKREDLPASTRFSADPFKARLPQAGRVRYSKLEDAGDLVLELGNQSRTVLQNAVVAPTSASKRASVAATRVCDLLLLGLPRGKELRSRVVELLQWMENMPKESEL